jgi:hypothetical protein
MQHDDKAGRWLQIVGREREHPEITGVGPEIFGFDDRTALARPEGPPEIRKAAQLWQTSQVVDILGERQMQLLGDRFESTRPRTDSCCTAK